MSPSLPWSPAVAKRAIHPMARRRGRYNAIGQRVSTMPGRALAASHERSSLARVNRAAADVLQTTRLAALAATLVTGKLVKIGAPRTSTPFPVAVLHLRPVNSAMRTRPMAASVLAERRPAIPTRVVRANRAWREPARARRNYSGPAEATDCRDKIGSRKTYRRARGSPWDRPVGS